MIFHIGLNKTGSTSLASALRILGYKVSDNSEVYKAKIITNLDNDRDPLDGIECDAITDNNAVNQNFERIYNWYPNGYYINTPRDTDDWLRSREQHVIGNQSNPNYKGGFLSVDKQQWRTLKEVHEVRVEQFRTYANVLHLPICSDCDKWGLLCSFLGRDRPNRKFPHKNRT